MQISSTGKFVPYNQGLKSRSQELRNGMTLAEKNLWYGCLRNYKFNFARQKPIHHFIVDFYCPALKLVIEVDGKQHLSEQGKAYDARRTAILESLGLRVIRFRNDEILLNLEQVKAKIDLITCTLKSP